jgi:hypothetical protein
LREWKHGIKIGEKFIVSFPVPGRVAAKGAGGNVSDHVSFSLNVERGKRRNLLVFEPE